jgi:hypothetical protein
VYVTFNVSPETTVRSPGDWKSDAENNTPDVPVVTEQMNAPATTPPELEMLNEEGVAELVITDGSAVEAVPKVIAGRLPE